MTKDTKPSFLMHLGLDSSMNIVKSFKNVKIVIMCGSNSRATNIAQILSNKLIGEDAKVKTIGMTTRYYMYKIKHCMVISHGMGAPSATIMCNEVV